jgi:hypothetical protein
MTDRAVTWEGGSAVVDDATGRILQASSGEAALELRLRLSAPVLVRLGAPAEVGGRILESPEALLRPGEPGFVEAALEQLEDAFVV